MTDETVEIRGRTFAVPDEGALVLTVSRDSLASNICKPDDYILTLGPLRYVDGIQSYSNGTNVITIKSDERQEAPADA